MIGTNPETGPEIVPESILQRSANAGSTALFAQKFFVPEHRPTERLVHMITNNLLYQEKTNGPRT